MHKAREMEDPEYTKFYRMGDALLSDNEEDDTHMDGKLDSKHGADGGEGDYGQGALMLKTKSAVL